MLVHGNRPEALRDLLVTLVRRHPLAPLETEVILAQSNGIAQWLKLALAADPIREDGKSTNDMNAVAPVRDDDKPDSDKDLANTLRDGGKSAGDMGAVDPTQDGDKLTRDIRSDEGADEADATLEGGLGIAAALEISRPSRFLWRAYRAVLGADAVPETSPFDKSRLVWRLMRLLLDTHVALWAVTDDARLGKEARQLIANPRHIVHASVVSLSERLAATLPDPLS